MLIQREKEIIGLRRRSVREDLCVDSVDRKSSENVCAKPTFFTIDFSAVTTSSWQSRGSDVTRPCSGRSSNAWRDEDFLSACEASLGELIIARQSDLSCRLISYLAFSSSRLLECVRCLLERTYVIWAYFSIFKSRVHYAVSVMMCAVK